jgi:hypothetical protein
MKYRIFNKKEQILRVHSSDRFKIKTVLSSFSDVRVLNNCIKGRWHYR